LVHTTSSSTWPSVRPLFPFSKLNACLIRMSRRWLGWRCLWFFRLPWFLRRWVIDWIFPCLFIQLNPFPRLCQQQSRSFQWSPLWLPMDQGLRPLKNHFGFLSIRYSCTALAFSVCTMAV
jgi:hypothetical protein